MMNFEPFPVAMFPMQALIASTAPLKIDRISIGHALVHVLHLTLLSETALILIAIENEARDEEEQREIEKEFGTTNEGAQTQATQLHKLHTLH